MTSLRLIDILPLLEDLPTSAHQVLGELLDISVEVVFAADGKVIEGHEDDVACVVAAECLLLARSRSRSQLLRKPLRALIPLADHVSRGATDLRARLPALSLREMRGLEGVDDSLARIISDVLAFASGPDPALRRLNAVQRIYAASVAGALASESRSSFRPFEVKLELLSAWGRWEAGIERFSQLAEAVSDGECPPEIQEAWADVGAVRLEKLGGGLRGAFDPTLSLTRLVSKLDNRQRCILLQRTWSLERSQTLDELARGLGVTSRERVRQLESNAVDWVRRELDRPVNAAVVRAASRLRQTIGAAVPLDRLRGTCWEPALDPDADDSRRMEALLLLHVAGPYERWGEWLVLRPAKRVVSASIAELEALFETGFPLVDEALATLERAGIRQDAARDWLGVLPRIRVLEGYVVPWTGTLADKAEIVLRVAGRPLALDEIVDAISQDFNIRTLRNYLLSDSRFRRLGLRVFGLDEWGGEEYTKISDEIAQEIERRGGQASLEELVETLTAQFHVSANSVRAYATGPQFERTTDGMIRVRTSQARVPAQPVEFTKRCYRIQGRWSYRITITDDTLRGSGTAIPQGFAGYLQLAHGGEVELAAREMVLRFTWPSLHPAVGSLRPALETLGAGEGDYLFLAADPREGVASLVHVTKDTLDGAATSQDRLLLEVGATVPTNKRAVVAVGDAVGLSAEEASWAAIRRRLRTRGEDDLLSLLPADDFVDESGLDDLMALVNL